MSQMRNRIWMAVSSVFALMLVVPALASAHVATAKVTCPSGSGPVTAEFHYDRFPDGNNTATQEIYQDGVRVATQTASGWKNDLKPATLTTPLPTDGKPHTYKAKTFWSADGGGSAVSSQVTCTPPPPPPTCPEGMTGTPPDCVPTPPNCPKGSPVMGEDGKWYCVVQGEPGKSYGCDGKEVTPTSPPATCPGTPGPTGPAGPQGPPGSTGVCNCEVKPPPCPPKAKKCPKQYRGRAKLLVPTKIGPSRTDKVNIRVVGTHIRKVVFYVDGAKRKTDRTRAFNYKTTAWNIHDSKGRRYGFHTIRAKVWFQKCTHPTVLHLKVKRFSLDP